MTNKKGRPKGNNNRTIFQTVRFTKAEYDALMANAESAGMSVSEFVRTALTKVNITPIDIDTVSEIRNARKVLVNVGNDINMLTKKIIYANNDNSKQILIDELTGSLTLINELKTALLSLQNTMLK